MSHSYYNRNLKRTIKRQNSKQKLKESEIIIISDDEEITEYLYKILTKLRFTNIITITKYCKETVCNYTKFFRELVIESLNINDEILGGIGAIVEIDESKFGDF
ncbi:9520_t:CDS:2 [Racocetra fulgida]|uniref:9520_t:CDS:1 n=1 Tax=Racocetra fulgida TaxID=60492 RepID=A0A9N8WEM5_9GLOM|nr:9520_t:CDS:2 [Racocetra fulgida]